MPYLRKGELLPVKGYELSIPSLFTKEGYGFPDNMHYDRGQLRKRDGKSQLGKPSIGNLNFLHLNTFDLSTLVVRLMAHTKRHVYQYNTSTKAFDDLTGLNDLTGSDTDFLDSCTIPELDWYIFTNYVDNIRKIQSLGNSQDLGGSPPKAKCIEYMTPYVFIANLNQNGLAIPTKGMWCDTGNPENWTAGGNSNSGSNLFTDDPTEIRRVRKMGSYLFVYKAGMIYRGWMVSTSDIFDFIIHSESRGLYSPRAIAESDSKHFFMGPQDFHVNNGVRVEDIGGSVREYIFSRLNRTLFNTCFSMAVEEFKEIWFFITTSGNSWPTEVWKYKYDLGFWYKDTVFNVISGCNYKKVSTIRWIDLVGSWLDQAWRWSDASGQADTPLQVFGNDKGICLQRDPRVFNDGPDIYTGKQETRDYCGIGDSGQMGIENDQEWYQIDFWASGSTVDIYYSIDEGVNWKFLKTKTLTQSMEKRSVYFDIVAPKIRFKFENMDPKGYFTFRSLIPYYLDAGNTGESDAD